MEIPRISILKQDIPVLFVDQDQEHTACEDKAKFTLQHLKTFIIANNTDIKDHVTINPSYEVLPDANSLFESLLEGLLRHEASGSMSSTVKVLLNNLRDEDTFKLTKHNLRSSLVDFGLEDAVNQSESILKRKDEYGEEEWEKDLKRARQYGSWVSSETFLHLFSVMFQLDTILIKPTNDEDDLPYIWFSSR